MENMVQMTIMVSQKAADLLRNEKGFEIVTRTVNKSYKPFLDAVIKNVGENGEVGKAVAETMTRVIHSDSSAAVGNILSHLDVGLQLVNIAVDVVGFYIVINKINEIDRRIMALGDQIEVVHDMVVSERLRSYHDLAMRFNDFATAFADKERVECEALNELVREISTFIPMVIRDTKSNAIDVEMSLEIVCSLVSMYTILIEEYYKEYYFQKQKKPANLDAYLQIFDQIDGEAFLNLIKDRLFLEKYYHTRQVLMTVNKQRQLVQQSKDQIVNQIGLVQLAKDQEGYNELMQLVNEMVRERLNQKIPEIAKEVGRSTEECADLLNQAMTRVGVAAV